MSQFGIAPCAPYLSHEVHIPSTGAIAKHSATYACQFASRIGSGNVHVFAGTGDGVGAREFRLKRSRGVNMSVCAVVAADPVHEEMSWLNAEARINILHISHLRCVPIPNVLVERRSVQT